MFVNNEHFDAVMQDIDRKSSARTGDIFQKTILAYTEITGEKSILMSDPGYTGIYDPYIGISLLNKINEWYKNHYSHLCFVPGFGSRALRIRGEIFKIMIPPGFNVDPRSFDPFKYIDKLQPSLLKILSAEEKKNVADRFNVYFQMGSRLALLNVKIKSCKEEQRTLIHRGREDLETATASILNKHIGPSMWSCQQASEKYMKAFILYHDPGMDLGKLKSKPFGHALGRLAQECHRHENAIGVTLKFYNEFNDSPNIRYEDPGLSMAQAEENIDLSYAACDLIANILNSKIPNDVMPGVNA